MKKLITLIPAIALLFACSSTSSGNYEASPDSLSEVRNTEVWGELGDLNPNFENKAMVEFLEQKPKDKTKRYPWIFYNLTKSIVELNFYKTYDRVIQIQLNDYDRSEFSNCLSKFLEWEKIAKKDRDDVSKTMCILNMPAGWRDDTDKNEVRKYNFNNQNYKINRRSILFHFDSRQFGGIELSIQFPSLDSLKSEIEIYYPDIFEIPELISVLSDKEIKKARISFSKAILKIRKTEEKYK